MPEITTPAVSSPAEVQDPFNGQSPSMDEYSRYRDTGEVPERFKPEGGESAPADTPEETVEAAPESAPEDDEQEPPQNIGAKAKKRFEKLAAENKELKRKLEAKSDAQTVSSPAQPAAEQQPQGEPKPEDTNADGTPKFKTYEDYTKALARWEIRNELAAEKEREAVRQAQSALKSQLDDARTRYEDADQIIFPAADAVNKASIPQAVKQVFADSDVFVDLCYVVGSDPRELDKFISLAASNPRAAIGVVFEYERAIKEELAKPVSKAPETRTAAPKPPSPVGGASTRAFDENDESISAEDWMRKRNAQLSKRNS